MQQNNLNIADAEYPAVSVIMPVYNSAPYLAEAIDSILNQSFKNFEFLIFNDGSTDQSKAIILGYTDSRIRFFDDANNTGYTVRLNQGFMESKGNYIARMDSDDIADLKRLEMQYQALERRPDVSLCGTFISFFGDPGLTYENWVIETESEMIAVNSLFNCPICHPTVMIRKSDLMNQNLRYDPSYETAEDFKLWTDMISKNLKLINLPHNLLSYRCSESQVSSAKNDLQRTIKHKILTEQLSRLKLNASALDLKIHEWLFSTNTYISADFLRKLDTWVQCLIYANRLTNIYDNGIFESYLYKKLNTHKILFNKKLSTLSFKNRCIYLIKKFVRWESIR